MSFEKADLPFGEQQRKGLVINMGQGSSGSRETLKEKKKTFIPSAYLLSQFSSAGGHTSDFGVSCGRDCHWLSNPQSIHRNHRCVAGEHRYHAAGIVRIILPTVLIYIFFQRYILAGVTAGAVKE